MSIENERLLSLIEFAQQAARMTSKAVARVEQHGLFNLYEHELFDLPGVKLNLLSTEGDDEIWMSIARLRETRPPEIKEALLLPWVEMVNNPVVEPKLRTAVTSDALVEMGTNRIPDKSVLPLGERKKPMFGEHELITLELYDQAESVRLAFKMYTDGPWKVWADEEKRRRKSIRLYGQLFTLQQQMQEGVVESPVEIVWGVGIGIWRTDSTSVNYPLLTRLCELALNPLTAAIEVKPRDTEPRLETDWYASDNNPGLGPLEKTGKEFFSKLTQTFSPFDRGTFEPLLQAAVVHLDPNGVYWPQQVPAEDRSLPKSDSNLHITDTWILFARPRTKSMYLQDLDAFKKKVDAIDNGDSFPGAVAAVIKDPSDTNEELVVPNYRGLSAVYGDGLESGLGNVSSKTRDLFFPMAFNDEQVRIVQLLDVSDGVVVQGPPGTGKTHTIANVICHYLADGKRVLVTSMKDPALAVLQDKLPPEIRPLAISLLTSEADGMKQFEYAISKIASEVQHLDRAAVAREITQIEQQIDNLHGRMSLIDRRVNEWAAKNLSRIELDGEQIEPQDAAHEVVQGAGHFEWILDPLSVGPEFAPKFVDSDVIRLRESRRILGPDIKYLDASLPQLVEFPESRMLLQAHQDLSRFALLSKEIEAGQVPGLVDSGDETIAAAGTLQQDIAHFHQLRREILLGNKQWAATVCARLRKSTSDDILDLFEALGSEIKDAVEARRVFLTKPVVLPAGIEIDTEFTEAFRNLSEGKRPFGFRGIVGKGKAKKKLDAIQVLTSKPDSEEDWRHVLRFVALEKQFRELAVRWNSLAPELAIEALPGAEPEHGLMALGLYALYEKIKAVVIAERFITEQAAKIFPEWPRAREVADADSAMDELENALRHHLTKHRLSSVWAVKERFQRVLDGRKGQIIDLIRIFLTDELGNPDVPDSEIQASWSRLMSELSRVHGLSSQLAIVSDVTSLIANSGAPKYAESLKHFVAGTVDALLPDEWRKSWRLKRLANHLEVIDTQDQFKVLSQKRQEVEMDLAKAYQTVVTKRTWLKLAENATPSIRGALMAYLNAIQKIGKGTGKRAVRYRQDARAAASHANGAVPCWIMPHYRVYESLPPELGCFDLVIIDEASQSDLTALPALLRAKKVLIVGDDKQVSPEGVGLEEEKIRSLMNRFLGNQVPIYRPQMSPERSIYDLFKVVFAKSAVMLKEHFRCVGPIIEYSKREFYNHELKPLRLPKTSERLDPPLVDVIVEDGYRNGDTNEAEARFIVNEIQRIVEDPEMKNRTIGMVSLLGDKQALRVWEMLTEELGPELMSRHRIACGDARTFQGKERHIMFLSMVVSPGEKFAPLSRDTFAQRFNVAASRAQDRMYLVRSVEVDDLSEADRLRRSLIGHFMSPFAQDEGRVISLRELCESPFEREVYDVLTERGYRVTPQIKVGEYRIDLVVEGHNDNRLAIECDGDRYHGPDRWGGDMRRQRALERAGWVFWRCFASNFIRRREILVNDLLQTLTERGIEPIGAENVPRSVHTEQRRLKVLNLDL
jgi:very-short-patch-repair endonuclease